MKAYKVPHKVYTIDVTERFTHEQTVCVYDMIDTRWCVPEPTAKYVFMGDDNILPGLQKTEPLSGLFGILTLTTNSDTYPD